MPGKGLLLTCPGVPAGTAATVVDIPRPKGPGHPPTCSTMSFLLPQGPPAEPADHPPQAIKAWWAAATARGRYGGRG